MAFEGVRAALELLPGSQLNVPAEGASVAPFAQAAVEELQRHMQWIRDAVIPARLDPAAQLLHEGLRAFQDANPLYAGRVYGLVGELVKLPDAQLARIISWKMDAVLRKVVVADHETRQALQQLMRAYLQHAAADPAEVRQARAADYLSFDTMSMPRQMSLPHLFGAAAGRAGGGGRGWQGHHRNQQQHQGLPPGQEAPQFVSDLAQAAEVVPEANLGQLVSCVFKELLVISTQQQAVNYRRFLAGKRCGPIRSIQEGMEVAADGATRIDAAENRAPAHLSQLAGHYGCVAADQQPRYVQLQEVLGRVQQLPDQEKQVQQLQGRLAEIRVQLDKQQQEKYSLEVVMKEYMQQLELAEQPRTTRARAQQQRRQNHAGAAGVERGGISEAHVMLQAGTATGRMTRRSLSNQQPGHRDCDMDAQQQQQQQWDQGAPMQLAGAGGQGGRGVSGVLGRNTTKRQPPQQDRGNRGVGVSSSHKRYRMR
jgi:hypothetical protein